MLKVFGNPRHKLRPSFRVPCLAATAIFEELVYVISRNSVSDRDWADFKSCAPSATIASADQELGKGDGESKDFALRKSYTSGDETYWRPITKPVSGRVFVAIDGQLQSEGTDYFVSTETGIVSFAVAPTVNVSITAGFEFDVPVRFELDAIETSVTNFSAGQIPNVPVVEVRV